MCVLFSRYVDVILNLIRIAGDYVSEEVWYRVIQIVINREEVQGYAAKTVFEVTYIMYIPTVYHDCVVKIQFCAQTKKIITIFSSLSHFIWFC